MTEKVKAKIKAHAKMDQFSIDNGQLIIAGKTIEQISAIAGQTPFYVYDRSAIKSNILRLRENFPNVDLHYAIKANPFSPVVCFIADLVDGLDVASGKELHTALASSMQPENISFAGPGKSINELQMAIASGVTINVESRTELQRIINVAQTHNLIANVALRLNPDFELKSSGMKMGGGSQQFGIDVEQLDPIFELLKSDFLNFVGLHIFTGSQNLRAESIISAHDNIFALVERLQNQYDFNLQHLNIGGGFGIPYFVGEDHLDLQPISENLNRLIEQYSSPFSHCKIILELGRYIVGNAGLYVCKITDKKISRGETFLITNGGLHHHLAASGNFGQVIRKDYPVIIANKMNTSENEVASVVGPLCTPLDLLANKMLLATAEIDDLVAIYQSGAYGFTASPRDFLSHNQPIEILL